MEKINKTDDFEKKLNIHPLAIKDNASEGYYFGGDQNWYKENTRYFGGCGSVAGANVLRSLAVTYPDMFKAGNVSSDLKEYAKDVITKDTYTGLMGKLYKSIGAFETPVINLIYNKCRRDNKIFKKIVPTFGLSVDRFIRGMLKYCEKGGLLLHAHCISTAFCSYGKGIKFIKDGLESSKAVVLLTSYNQHELTTYSGKCGCLEKPNSNKESMKSHFATITGIDKEGNLTISTWGRTTSVSYDKLYKSWQSRKAFTSSLVYFEPTLSRTQCRTDRYKSIYTVLRSFVNTLVGRALLQ